MTCTHNTAVFIVFRVLVKLAFIYTTEGMDFGFDYSTLQPFAYASPYQNMQIIRGRGAPKIISQSLRKLYFTSISDDFYSNLIDWSSDSVYYSVANTVYAYNFFSEGIESIYHSPGNGITCLKHNGQSNTLCVGTSAGSLVLVDIETRKPSAYLIHKSRIGALETFGGSIITGSRDRLSKIVDLRTGMSVTTFSTHLQEVCGLSLNSRQQYLASGGNDNKVFIYDVRRTHTPYAGLCDHRAAVKALSWSPNISSQLVSGGGTADKTIKMWDLASRARLVHSYDFESQICNLKWLRNNKILSTFGYSNDDIKLLSNFQVEKQFVGHKNRVIHFSVEDDERFFVSGSSDSTIRFWSIDYEESVCDIKIR